MLEPSIDELQEQIKSQYTLVTLSARRARQIGEGRNVLIDNPKSSQNLGVALEEIKAGKVHVRSE